MACRLRYDGAEAGRLNSKEAQGHGGDTSNHKIIHPGYCRRVCFQSRASRADDSVESGAAKIPAYPRSDSRNWWRRACLRWRWGVAREESIWEEAFGWADRKTASPPTSTRCILASISKPFTATALMILVARGQDLERPINGYLGDSPLTVMWAGRRM